MLPLIEPVLLVGLILCAPIVLSLGRAGEHDHRLHCGQAEVGLALHTRHASQQAWSCSQQLCPTQQPSQLPRPWSPRVSALLSCCKLGPALALWPHLVVRVDHWVPVAPQLVAQWDLMPLSASHDQVPVGQLLPLTAQRLL